MLDIPTLERVREAVLQCLPAERVSLTLEDRLAHGHDAWPAAAKWTDEERAEHAPLAVVWPETTAEVQTVLRVAMQAGVSVVPFGAGSGVVGSVRTGHATVALDTRRLRGIVAFRPVDLIITVRAGTPAQEVEDFLQAQGYTLGHYPQSLPLATVGGLVATRSSGTFSSKYGNVEDRVLALEVVLADGQVARNGIAPRSSTGPRWIDLFIGSEGTLGVITAVTWRIVPCPQHRQLRAFAFERFSSGLAAIQRVLRAGLVPALVRLYEPGEASHLLPGAGSFLLLLAFEGLETVAMAEEDAARTICCQQGGTDLGPEAVEKWLRGRFRAGWLEEGNRDASHMADAIEVSALWSDLEQLYQQVMAALHPIADRVWAHVSHVYPQGASIYFIVFFSGRDRDQLLGRYHAAWRAVMEITLAAGGSIAHHHGIGQARAPWIEAELSSGRAVLAAIKTALDPQHRLNPGALGLGGP